MSFPIVSHKRNRYSVVSYFGIHFMKQHNVYMEDFPQTPMGATSAIDETRCDAALAATVTDLILTINHGTATQTDLDRYAFAYF